MPFHYMASGIFALLNWLPSTASMDSISQLMEGGPIIQWLKLRAWWIVIWVWTGVPTFQSCWGNETHKCSRLTKEVSERTWWLLVLILTEIGFRNIGKITTFQSYSKWEKDDCWELAFLTQIPRAFRLQQGPAQNRSQAGRAGEACWGRSAGALVGQKASEKSLMMETVRGFWEKYLGFLV